MTDIDKFSYLKGYLSGATDKCIEGVTLTIENYKEALALLRERCVNPQLIITSHMKDQVEGYVRALHTPGVKSDHYGALPIPIILERLPDEIRLEISRKLEDRPFHEHPERGDYRSRTL